MKDDLAEKTVAYELRVSEKEAKLRTSKTVASDRRT